MSFEVCSTMPTLQSESSSFQCFGVCAQLRDGTRSRQKLGQVSRFFGHAAQLARFFHGQYLDCGQPRHYHAKGSRSAAKAEEPA
jgi:hypothetical protein